jgi:hypothetical protein
MSKRTAIVPILAAAAALIASASVAGGPKTCMEGVDIKASTPFLDVYCGPASAVVETPGLGAAIGKPGSKGKATFKPGTCVKGIRGPGSWDLYLGKDKSKGPWTPMLHLSKPTASAKPGLYMEARYTQWSATGGTLKLTITPTGGSFSGTALVKSETSASHVRQPIKGTFKC